MQILQVLAYPIFQLQIAPRSRIGDERGPLGAGLQEQASNHLKLLWSKAMVVSVMEKSRLRLWQVRIRETSTSEPLMRRRNELDGVKTGGLCVCQDKHRGNLLTVCAAPGVKVA